MNRHKWSDVKAKMSPESRARGDQLKADLSAALHLDEVRKARQLSQQQLAATMESTQGQVSKIEHSADLYISTLRRFIEAMHGQLVLEARFPDGMSVPVHLRPSVEEEPEAPKKELVLA